MEEKRPILLNCIPHYVGDKVTGPHWRGNISNLMKLLKSLEKILSIKIKSHPKGVYGKKLSNFLMKPINQKYANKHNAKNQLIWVDFWEN